MHAQTISSIVVPSLFGALCGGSGTPCGGSSRKRNKDSGNEIGRQGECEKGNKGGRVKIQMKYTQKFSR